MESQYKLAVFDLDGTLADTIPDIKWAVEHSAAQFGTFDIPDEVMRAHITGGAAVLIGGIFADLGIREFDLEQHIALFAEYYEAHCAEETYLYDGAEELLKTLRQMGCKVALCTMKSSRFTNKMLEALGIGDLFDAMLCEDQMLRHKPDAWSIETLAERFEVSMEQVIMIGDGMTDVCMAENAGCCGVAALFGYGDPQDLTAHSKYQIRHISEVLDIVKGMNMDRDVITLHGDIDLYNVGELKKQLQQCGAKDLVIDAHDLQYIDSTGLGVLVSSLKKRKENDGKIRIIGLKPHIYKIFALTSLDRIFEIEVAQ